MHAHLFRGMKLNKKIIYMIPEIRERLQSDMQTRCTDMLSTLQAVDAGQFRQPNTRDEQFDNI